MDQPVRLADSLTDGEIILDSYRIEDVDDHMRGEDEEMLRRFGSPHRPTREQTLVAINRWIDARRAGGPMFAYALRQPSGLLMGGCEIRVLSRERAAVSYWIYPEFRNRGYATRAITLLANHAAQIDGLRQLEAHVDADNLASRRLAEKAGFVEAGAVTDEEAGTISKRVLYLRHLGL